MASERPNFAEVLAAHADCVGRVEVHADKTGTMHYRCGIAVTPVRGLVAADRAHLAAALTAEHERCLADDDPALSTDPTQGDQL